MSILLTMIKPTGGMTIGHYAGVFRELSKPSEHTRHIGIANLHSITVTPFKNLKSNTKNLILDLVACGVDINEIYLQSHITVTELSWILSCVGSKYSDLIKQVQFKEKRSESSFVSIGLFTYPVLMTADILSFKTEIVPVGTDQLQHLELCRRIAKKFNTEYGNIFPIPEAIISSTPRIMSLNDPNKKMSKTGSPKSYIGLYDKPIDIRAKIKSAITDSNRKECNVPTGAVKNLMDLLIVCELTDEYDQFSLDFVNQKLQYSNLKEVVANGLIKLTSRFTEMRKDAENEQELIMEKVLSNSKILNAKAEQTLFEVKNLIGMI